MVIFNLSQKIFPGGLRPLPLPLGKISRDNIIPMFMQKDSQLVVV